MNNSVGKLLKIIILVIGCCLAGAVNSACAQGSGPEVIIDSAMTRLIAGDWNGFVRYLHPSTLQEFKYYVIKVTQIRLQTGGNDPRFDLIFGRPTLEEVQNAPADVLLANFLRGATQSVADFRQALAQTRWQRLGVVDEGANLKHVVARQTYIFGDNSVQRVEVITLEKDGTAWKLQLPPNIETFLDELGWPRLE